MAIEC